MPRLVLTLTSDVEPSRGDFTAVETDEGGGTRGVHTPRDTPQFLLTPRRGAGAARFVAAPAAPAPAAMREG